MSTPVPPREPAPNTQRQTPWRPSRSTLLVAAIATAVGLTLFLMIWMRDRGDSFYRAAQTTDDATPGQEFEPLPAPLPADTDAGNASGMGEPQADDNDNPEPMIESPPMPPQPVVPPAPPAPPPVAMAPADVPVPIDSPAPRYPPQALRRGDSGTVILRVHVDPQGNPVAVDLVQSSRSRELDRAASEAVKRWRFRPAQRDGQPVNGVVQIPIAFSADR